MTNLPKIVIKNTKRLGRGYGSGKGGHTVGRGQKGQKARGSINVIFEGYKMKKSLIKRLPFRRGKGKFASGNKPIIINVKYLENFPNGTEINVDSLIKAGIVNLKDAREVGVKILGDGSISKKLTINLPTSKSARKKIEKAGGKVI
jgi:large subunit ribosomal protein L15